MAATTAATLALAVAACGGSKADPYSVKKFAPSFPKFLPKKTLDPSVDRVLIGTAERPALSVQGVGIEVTTPRWSVLVDVSGPIVPGEGLPHQTGFTTCTWTVTLSQATATVPVSLADFNSIDHLGTRYPMQPVEGQPPVPTSVGPGQKVSFEMRAYELVGEGIMRWAPDGHHIVAMWDYEVEND